VDQLTSPDIPAWVCYLIVLAFGLLVARSQINELLASYPDHWGFLGTWVLFAAHGGLPVGVFWLLDYSSALHDTSLFAALLVALGYRQIVVGGVQGIQMPGPTPKLWEPFQAWVKRVADRIASQQKRYRDAIAEALRTYFSTDHLQLPNLEHVARVYSSDAPQLGAKLAAMAQAPPPPGMTAAALQEYQNRQRAQALLEDLRASQPERYAQLLLRQGRVPGKKLTLYSAKLPLYMARLLGQLPKLTGWAGAVAILLSVALSVSWFRQDTSQLWYHQWRFGKANATERDRFRSREYLSAHLRAASLDAANGAQRVVPVVEPLLRQLRYKDVPSRLADDVLRLVVDCHSTVSDLIVVPSLIEGLRTDNADIRLRIQRTLLTLQGADYPRASVNRSLAAWVPAKDESPGDIDGRVRAWEAWWTQAQSDSILRR
jgi:hypothetical protein